MAILTICVIILVSHFYVKPFRSAVENFLETLSLTIFIVLSGFTLVRTLYYGRDFSSLSSSLELLNKLNFVESILILAPVTIVMVVAICCISTRLIFLVLFSVLSICRKLRNLFQTCFFV